MDISARLIAYSVDRREVLLFNKLLQDGSRLQFRCSDTGSYKLRGQQEAVCKEGEWSSPPPTCQPLDPLNEQNEAAPITFTVSGSPHSISNKGELIVARSAAVTFGCLFPRKKGQPKWETTSTYRTYPQSWERIEVLGRKVDAYQLSVAGAQPEDAGIFHCITPQGKRQSVRLRIESTIAQFSCPSGYRVQGSSTSACQSDGQWSHMPPRCNAIQCPPLMLTTPNLVATVSSYKFGGIAQFFCKKGFTLIGNEHIHCTASGLWSDKQPHCAVVECPEVQPPSNGFIIGRPKKLYKKGDIVMFGCGDSHLLTGSDFVMCQSNGKWTEQQTSCTPYCKHPGRPAHGETTTSSKDYYLVGEKIVFFCPSNEYKLNSDNVLVCIGPGKWNRSVPQCLPNRKDLNRV